MPLASQVAITYSVIGFLFAFLIGVPMAKIGLKKGLASHPEKLSPAVMRGIYKPEEQRDIADIITDIVRLEDESAGMLKGILE